MQNIHDIHRQESLCKFWKRTAGTGIIVLSNALFMHVVNAMWSREHCWTSRKQAKAQAERILTCLFAAVQNTCDSSRETCLYGQARWLNKEGREHDAHPESDSPREKRATNTRRKPLHLNKHTVQNGCD